MIEEPRSRIGKCDKCQQTTMVVKIELSTGRIDLLCLACLEKALHPLQRAKESKEGHYTLQTAVSQLQILR